MNSSTIYEKLRSDFSETLEFWGENANNDDVLDFSLYRLPEALETSESFKLYRYMPANYYAIRGFETQKIHLSSNGVMNDVYEGIPNCVLSDNAENDIQQLSNLAVMCCFSETPTNPIMWSHYADSNRGICIEYDLKKLKSDPYKLAKHLFPIIYATERPFKQDLQQLIHDLNQLCRDIADRNVYDGETDFNRVLPILETKGTEWSYEKEWRIVFTKKQLYDEDDSVLDSGNIPFECVSGIYLGVRIDPEYRQNIIEICERFREKGIPVPVFQMQITNDTFQFNTKQIYPSKE